MPGPYYVLTARTAGALRQLLDDGGTTATARANAGARTRGLTWVKVTGSAVGGWYPGLVSIDSDGTFSDLTGVVNVASASGAALVTGTRYLCSRTGDTASGVPRFRTVPPSGGGDVFGPASAIDNTIARFDGPDGKHIQSSAASVLDGGVIVAPAFQVTSGGPLVAKRGAQIILAGIDPTGLGDLEARHIFATNEGVTGDSIATNIPATDTALFVPTSAWVGNFVQVGKQGLHPSGADGSWAQLTRGGLAIETLNSLGERHEFGFSFFGTGTSDTRWQFHARSDARPSDTALFEFVGTGGGTELPAIVYATNGFGAKALDGTRQFGKTGTLAAGATVTGGIITNLGSGSGGGGTGTVTSVDVSGGTTGMTFTGGPVTTSGTITMSGTLDVDNGGTGRTSHTAYAVLCGGTTSTGAQQSVASLGTAGQVLTSAGAGALPTWSNAAGGLTDGDKGDITVGGGGTTLTIDTAAVNYAKLQDMAALSVLGRAANTAGVPDAITATLAGAPLQLIGNSIAFGPFETQNLYGSQVRAYPSATGSLTSGGIAAVVLDVKTQDKLSEFSSSTFIPFATGLYLIELRVGLNFTTCSRVILDMYVGSGTFFRRLYDLVGSPVVVPCMALVQLTAGQVYYFTVTVLGSGLSLLGGEGNTSLNIRRFY